MEERKEFKSEIRELKNRNEELEQKARLYTVLVFQHIYRILFRSKIMK